MKDDEPSKTAWRSAIRRAEHQMWDTPRVLDDPLALKIIGRDEEAALRNKGAPSTTGLESTIRAFAVARSRFANDALAEAVARGVRQHVVMGAGYETSSFGPGSEGLRVFEIDHPATQARKKQLLAALDIGGGAGFVPVDFKRQKFAEELVRAGWDPSQPTFFSWLGVTSYLSHAEVFETLAYIASLPKGSEIVLDISTPTRRLPLWQRAARAVYGLKLRLEREQIGTRFEPGRMAGELRGIGFSDAVALERRDINARYFPSRTDGLAVSDRSALIRAVV
jgi:methyltransferase (TIGR00027 family)